MDLQRATANSKVISTTNNCDIGLCSSVHVATGDGEVLGIE